MKVLAVVVMALLLGGCAHKPGAGSYLDAGTTWAVVESGALAEANPLLSGLSGPQAAIASLALKQGVKVGLTATGLEAHGVDRGVETAGMAAGGWNLALLAGAAYPLAGAAALFSGLAYLWIGGGL